MLVGNRFSRFVPWFGDALADLRLGAFVEQGTEEGAFVADDAAGFFGVFEGGDAFWVLH